MEVPQVILVQDWAIGIRTAVIKDQKAVIQVGAGIFADFHPKTELEETTNKAMALIKALKLVEHGLDGEIDQNSIITLCFWLAIVIVVHLKKFLYL